MIELIIGIGVVSLLFGNTIKGMFGESNSSFEYTLCLARPFVSSTSLFALSINPVFKPQFQQALMVLTKMALLFGLVGKGLPLLYDLSTYSYRS